MKLDVREMILNQGFQITYEDSHGIYAEDDIFKLRHYYGGRIELGVAKDFDRWGNSVDFVFSVPKTEKRWIKAFSEVREKALAGEYGWAEDKKDKPKYVNRSH